MRAWILAIAFALTCATPAFAQREFGAGFLVPRTDEEITISSEARANATVLIVPVRHSQVGRLQNDIRGTGLVNSDRVVIPSGTLVYRAVFAETRGGRFIRELRGWCAQIIENERPRGHCMFPQGRGAVLGVLPSRDSFYAPRQLADYGLRPITLPQVQPDPAVSSELPSMHYRLTFVEWDQEDADLRQHIIVGGEQFELGTLSAPRAVDGSATISVYGVTVRLTPSPDGGAIIERVSE